MSGPDDLLRRVNQLENKPAFLEIAAEPLFDVEPNLNSLYAFINSFTR
jgi:hypothetical protein